MDEELKTHLDGLASRIDALETRMNARFDGMETRVNGRFDRLAEAVATEVGSLHEQIKDVERRLQRVDGNTITTMELLTRQSRWHEQSDNAVRELTVRQGEFARKLDELRGEKQ